MGQHIPDFNCPSNILPETELDVPWYGVVIHDIPAQPLLESYQGTELMEHLWVTATEQMGIPVNDIQDMCILCQDEDLEKKDQLSIRIMLEDPTYVNTSAAPTPFYLRPLATPHSTVPRRDNTNLLPPHDPPTLNNHKP